MQLTDSHTHLDLAKILIFVVYSLNCMGKQSQKENLDHADCWEGNSAQRADRPPKRVGNLRVNLFFFAPANSFFSQKWPTTATSAPHPHPANHQPPFSANQPITHRASATHLTEKQLHGPVFDREPSVPGSETDREAVRLLPK
jgi:hypothetical protein